jgi:hypothetical protein
MFLKCTAQIYVNITAAVPSPFVFLLPPFQTCLRLPMIEFEKGPAPRRAG